MQFDRGEPHIAALQKVPESINLQRRCCSRDPCSSPWLPLRTPDCLTFLHSRLHVALLASRNALAVRVSFGRPLLEDYSSGPRVRTGTATLAQGLCCEVGKGFEGIATMLGPWGEQRRKQLFQFLTLLPGALSH